MTLRDLTPKQVATLQKKCLKDWEIWAKQNPLSAPLIPLAAVQKFWSNGLKAGLAFAPSPKP